MNKVIKFPAADSAFFSSKKKIEYSFDDLTISALNFIREYEGQSLDFYGRLEYSMAEACDVANFLLENNIFRYFGEFDWYFGQDVSTFYTERFSLYDVSAPNKVKKLFGDDIDKHDVIELILFNYIQEFTDSFQLREDSNQVYFTLRDNVKKKAFQSGNFDLVTLINSAQNDTSHKLSFLGIGHNFDKSKAILYKRNEVANVR